MTTEPTHSIIRDPVEWQSLRYSCGQDIFCRGCRDSLDAHRAVEITAEADGKIQSVMVLCVTCFDRAERLGNLERAAQAMLDRGAAEARIVFIDGREFAREGDSRERPARPALVLRADDSDRQAGLFGPAGGAS